MPRFGSNFLVTIFATHYFLWKFQGASRAVVKQIIIYSTRHRFYALGGLKRANQSRGQLALILQQVRLGLNLTGLVYFYFFAFRLGLLTNFEV